MKSGPRRWPAIIALALLPALAAAQSADPPMTGSWVGVFQTYPVFVQMSLEVGEGSADGTHQAQLRLEPLSSKTRGGPTGVLSVTVRHDRQAGSIEIIPGPDARAVGGVPRFVGVFDRARRVFGGVLVPGRTDASPYFILGQKGFGEDGFLEPLRKAAEAKAGGGGGINPFRGGADREAIAAWASRLLEEYPDLDPYRTEMGALFLKARNLFADDHFQEHFGKAFDEMSGGDLGKIASAIRKFPPPRSNLPEEKPAGAALSVQRAFEVMTGTYASPDITLSVIARRPMVAWRTARLGLLNASPAPGLDDIAAIEAAESVALATFWPSERAAFAEALSTARGRAAGPTLTAKVTELIAASQGLDGARQMAAMLAARPAAAVGNPAAGRRGAAAGRARGPVGPQPVGTDIPSLFGIVDPGLAQAERARIEQRIDELLAAQVAADRQALGALGSGMAGLEAGVAWYAAAVPRYGELAQRPAVQGLLEELATRRRALLQSAEPVIAAQIGAAASSADVNGIVRRTLAVPSDRSDPAGSRLLALGNTRTQEVAAGERAVAAERARERQEAASACARASTDPGEAAGEPTERDMCRAIEASLRAVDENLDNAKKSSCGNATRQDPMAAVMCLMTSAAGVGGGPQVSLSGFQKVACVSAAASGKPGFICDLILRLQTGNAMTRAMFDAVGASVSTRRFVKRGSAWMVIPREN